MNQLAIPFPAPLHRRIRMAKAKDCTEAQDSREPRWSDTAYAYLIEFAKQREGEFLAEEAIYWMTSHGLERPKDKRAFGTVFVLAVRRGAIARHGVSNSTHNASWKPTYVRGQV